MRAELRARLLAYDDLADLIAARLHWTVAPAAAARPYITAQTIADDPRAQSKDGPGRLHYLHVQFDCVGDTYDQAAQTSAELLNALSTVHGWATDSWAWQGVYVLERGRDDYDPAQDASEKGLFRRIVEINFHVLNLAGLDDPGPDWPYFPPVPSIPDTIDPEP